MKKLRLLACKGCGSAIAEAAFELAGLPYEREEVDYSAGSPTRERLLAVNPLGQVPALVLPDGRVITESAAMVLYAHDHAPHAHLVPGREDPTRESFHRWLFFLVAAIYPTFTYGDEPAKWVPEKLGAKALRESTDRHREALWQQVEAEAREPWFLGEQRSALDLYLAVMTRWRPRRAWFAANTPRIVAIAQRAAALPEVSPVMARNFG